MFDTLSGRLSSIFDALTRRGALGDADVTEALREVRRALLEADVALDVVKRFIEDVREKAVGQQVIKSVTPGQQVVKIVHDALVAALGGAAQPIDFHASAPVVILMVGLQGSGKTTTTAKIAKRLTSLEKKKILMASLDTRRPAAMEQLAVLGGQVGVETLPIVAGQTPIQIAKRALDAARLGGFDVVMLDTAGRTTLDDALMAEVVEVRKAASPHEILLVADALTGQDAVHTATAFDRAVGITGLVLTRVDGDSRGGAALSMRGVTGKPIKLVGVGETMEALEEFHPERVANRILGMGDIVSLVEKAAHTLDQDKAQAMAERMKKGAFDLNDLRDQLGQMLKIGGIGGLMGMMPGMGKMKSQMADAGMDDTILHRQIAIINSMTPLERRNPDLLKASRKKRVALGSGAKVEDVNRLLKQHRGMADMMKMLGGKNKGKLAGLANMFGLGGGMPSPDQLQAMMPKAGSGLPEKMPDLPSSLPGLGGGLSGLGSLSNLFKK